MGTPRMSRFAAASSSRTSEAAGEPRDVVAIPIEGPRSSSQLYSSSSQLYSSSLSAAMPLSSPLQQKTPARSYYQSAYYGSPGKSASLNYPDSLG